MQHNWGCRHAVGLLLQANQTQKWDKAKGTTANQDRCEPKIPKPLVYAQVSPLGTSFATP